MQFNTYEYLLWFLPVVLVMYGLARNFASQQATTGLLVVASLVFYGWHAPKTVLFLLAMMAFNWTASRPLSRQWGGRALLMAVVAMNLLPLVFYKYTTFLIPQLRGILKLAAPLGISYFTFVQISFAVDTFRGKKVAGFLDYALASVFWPKLVAGPIVRPAEFADQWRRPCNRRMQSHRIVLAIFIFILGLGKKVVLADSLGGLADAGWSAQPLTTGAAWLSTVAYSLQLYFDFSGYSDMAWGSALLFNIRLPWNFNSPYKATSIQDFWRRWHISLSLWLRDYLYFTFGGSRQGLPKTIRNVFFTFLIGGIWHGAGWTFVIWGAIHGIMLSVNNLWRRLQRRRLPALPGWALTALGVHLAWVFFRAPDAMSAFSMLQAMFGFVAESPNAWDWRTSSPVLTYPFVAVCAAILLLPNTRYLAYSLMRGFKSPFKIALAGATCGAVILLATVCGMNESVRSVPFVYFQF